MQIKGSKYAIFGTHHVAKPPQFFMEAEPTSESRGGPHQAHNRPAQPAPAYKAPTQVPVSSSQPTLEESLKAFVQITGQSISEVKNATMVNTQAIAKLEVQMGQMANHLGEREKGKLPNQPMPNSKL